MLRASVRQGGPPKTRQAHARMSPRSGSSAHPASRTAYATAHRPRSCRSGRGLSEDSNVARNIVDPHRSVAVAFHVGSLSAQRVDKSRFKDSSVPRQKCRSDYPGRCHQDAVGGVTMKGTRKGRQFRRHRRRDAVASNQGRCDRHR